MEKQRKISVTGSSPPQRPSLERISEKAPNDFAEKHGTIRENDAPNLDKQNSSAGRTLNMSNKRKKSSRVDQPDLSRLSLSSRASFARRDSSTRFSLSSRAPSALRKESKERKTSYLPSIDNTVKFVYSEAVEKAIRTYYRSSAYPPVSAANKEDKNETVPDIVKLPELYSDMVSFRRKRRYNVDREKSYYAKHLSRKNSFLNNNEDASRFESMGTRLPKALAKRQLADAMAAFRAKKAGEKMPMTGVKLPNIMLAGLKAASDKITAEKTDSVEPQKGSMLKT